MTCQEAQELITGLVDGELSERERHSVASHLKECLSCERAYRDEQALKEAVRAAGLSLSVPASLREKILSGGVVPPQATESLRPERSRFMPFWLPFRPALVVAAVLILALPAFYLLNQKSEPTSLAAIETYGSFLRGDLPMISAKDEEAIKEQLIRSVGGRFGPMGYDLSAMNLKPAAATVHEINRRKILVTVYQGQGSLICYTFLGGDDDAPDNAALFFDPEKKMNFYAFSRGGVNAVLHREGDVICILASRMPMEELLALARGQARPSS